VIPRSLFDKEVSHRGLTELVIVNSMRKRAVIADNISDGFIALPGAIGTLDEWLDVLICSHLEFQKKPCGALNTRQHYNP
jgi:predicted Rossmann-fold nucleotide-binding protein